MKGGVAVLLCLVLAAGAAQGQETGGVTLRQQPAAEESAVSGLDAGRLLFREGRFGEAREILLQVVPASEEESIDRRFLLGVIALEEGRPREAVEGFESILSEHPELLRVRLELARAYYLIGDDEKSRHHFSYVLGAEGLPRGVENNVEAFLNRIQGRKRWSADFSLAVLPQSNVNQGTEERIVYLGPLPLRLNEDARRSSGVGLQASGGLGWQPVLGGDWRGRLALSGRVQRYRDSRLNDVIVGSDVGALRLFDGGHVGGGLRVQRRWRDSEGYLWRRGVWGAWQRQFLRRNRLEVNVEVAHLDHDERNHSNGWVVRVAPDVERGLSARSRMRLGVSWQLTEASVGYESSHQLGASGGLTYGFAGGLVASVDVGLTRQRYHGDHPLFAVARKEVYGFAGVRWLHRELRWQGFAPYVEYRYERNNSNVDFFDYDNHVGNVGVTRRF